MELSRTAWELVVENQTAWVATLEPQEQEAPEEKKDDSFFFHWYFRKLPQRNFRKSRIYKTDWFDLNYYLLNQHFRLAGFDAEPLRTEQVRAKTRDASDMKEVQEVFLKYVSEMPYEDIALDRSAHPAQLLETNTLITQLLTTVFAEAFRGLISRLEKKGKSKSDLFHEIEALATIIRSTWRNDTGFLALFVADQAEGNFATNYISLIRDCLVFRSLREINLLIDNYELISAV